LDSIKKLDGGFGADGIDCNSLSNSINSVQEY